MNKKVVIVIILVLLIAVIGGVTYYFMMPKKPCGGYTDTSSNISRECIIDMWKNVAGCPNSLAPSMLAYYTQITKPVGSPAVTIDGKSVAAAGRTLGAITADARLWASLATNMHREACYGTDPSKWPKNLLKTQADYEAYSNRVGAFTLTNVKAVGAFVKINPDVLDTQRAGIIFGNYPEPIVTTTGTPPTPTGNSQLAMEIHLERKPRLFINDFAIDWKVNDQIPLNTWAHVAFVLRDDKIEYYRDGVLKETRTGAPPVLARVPNIKYGYDNRPNSIQQVPNKMQVSNLLISQGTNSVAWTAANVAALFANYKPAV